MRGGHRDVAVAGNTALEAMTHEAGDGAGLGRGDAEEEGVVGRRVPALLEVVKPFDGKGRAGGEIFGFELSAERVEVGGFGRGRDSLVEDGVDDVEGGRVVVVEMEALDGLTEVGGHDGRFEP